MSTRKRRITPRLMLIGLVALGLLVGPTGAVAGQPDGSVVVTVWEPGGLQDDSVDTIITLADELGASYSVYHTGTLRLSAVTRSGDDVQRAPDGFHYPMASLALDPAASEPFVGDQGADVLERGMVLMGETSARLRGAQAGDEITFVGWDGLDHTTVLGLIVPDEAVDGAELVFSIDVAASFEFVRPSSIKILNAPDAEDARTAVSEAFTDRRLGISLSTDRPNPDSVSSSATLKERFGEFAYRVTGRGDQIEIEEAWLEANIVTVDLPILGVFKCHRKVVPYLEAVVDDIVHGGLASQIDSDDFQLAGGCFNSRMIRGGDKGGAISRHAWGAAIDINPSTNPYGGAITMDRQVAEIFHYWGFAWGGGWVYTDGGHFEWKRLPRHVVRV